MEGGEREEDRGEAVILQEIHKKLPRDQAQLHRDKERQIRIQTQRLGEGQIE